jgi:hypothetical protein
MPLEDELAAAHAEYLGTPLGHTLAAAITEIADLRARLHAAEVERDCSNSTLHHEQGLRSRAEGALSDAREENP